MSGWEFCLRKKILVVLAIGFCLLCVLTVIILCFVFRSNNSIVVTVNKEKIYQSQIDNVTSQMSEGSIDPKRVLETSIDRLLVVQKGKSLDINCSEHEIQQLIADYQKNLGKFYDRGIQIYGKEAFIEGLTYNIIFNKTKEWFYSSQYHPEEPTVSVLEDFLKEKNIALVIDESNYEIIKEKYVADHKNTAFQKWIQELRSQSNILYANN